MSAQGDDLTLAEAVPLATVLLQRLLADAGVRSLAIKGPSFAALGIRAPKQSHDVDLLIRPGERRLATETLTASGWFVLGYDLPPEVDDIIYSTTFGHERLPSTVDVHHRYPGLLLDPDAAFEALWGQRQEVRLAGQTVVAPSAAHALIVEALHRLRSTREVGWGVVADQVASGVSRGVLTADQVVAAAEMVGARWTAAPLIEALGGRSTVGPPDRGFDEWRRRCGPHRGGAIILGAVARRAPWRLSQVVWGQLHVSEPMARFWAEAHGVRYRHRAQILLLRVLRLVRPGRK